MNRKERRKLALQGQAEEKIVGRGRLRVEKCNELQARYAQFHKQTDAELKEQLKGKHKARIFAVSHTKGTKVKKSGDKQPKGWNKVNPHFQSSTTYTGEDFKNAHIPTTAELQNPNRETWVVGGEKFSVNTVGMPKC